LVASGVPGGGRLGAARTERGDGRGRQGDPGSPSSLDRERRARGTPPVLPRPRPASRRPPPPPAASAVAPPGPTPPPALPPGKVLPRPVSPRAFVPPGGAAPVRPPRLQRRPPDGALELDHELGGDEQPRRGAGAGAGCWCCAGFLAPSPCSPLGSVSHSVSHEKEWPPARRHTHIPRQRPASGRRRGPSPGRTALHRPRGGRSGAAVARLPRAPPAAPVPCGPCPPPRCPLSPTALLSCVHP